jgi:hypothetical protein
MDTLCLQMRSHNNKEEHRKMDEWRRSGVFHFWVYQQCAPPEAARDWDPRGKLHRGDCRYCRDGQGMRDRKGGASGDWHGPFATVAEAYHKCRPYLDKNDIEDCVSCLGNRRIPSAPEPTKKIEATPPQDPSIARTALTSANGAGVTIKDCS